MRLSETSSTVTGSMLPSSVKMRVMPTLRPTNPIVIPNLYFLVPACAGMPAAIGRPFTYYFALLLDLDFDVYAGRKVQLHQRIDRLVGRIDDVHQSQVRADLELVARSLVDMRRAQQVEALAAGRQRHRAAHHGTRALGRVDDLERRLVDQPVVVRLEADADS